MPLQQAHASQKLMEGHAERVSLSMYLLVAYAHSNKLDTQKMQGIHSKLQNACQYSLHCIPDLTVETDTLNRDMDMNDSGKQAKQQGYNWKFSSNQPAALCDIVLGMNSSRFQRAYRRMARSSTKATTKVTVVVTTKAVCIGGQPKVSCCCSQ